MQVGPAPQVAFPDWEDVLADIGDRIRAERQARGWSQTELARRAGLDWGTVKRLESGVGWLRTFTQVCWGLQVPMDHLLSDQWQMPTRAEPSPSLSEQQMKVLRVVADGRSLSAAALALGMPRPAVAAQVSQIYRRLGVVDLPRAERRAAAVRIACQHGLIDAA
jgi:transcriptional regulator with XRE-family HTH domain